MEEIDHFSNYEPPIRMIADDGGGRQSGVSDPAIGKHDCAIRTLSLMTRTLDDDPGEVYRRWYEVMVVATRQHYEERGEAPPIGIEKGVPGEVYMTILREHGFEEQPELSGKTLEEVCRVHSDFIADSEHHTYAVIGGDAWDYLGEDPPYEFDDPGVLDLVRIGIVDRTFIKVTMPSEHTSNRNTPLRAS